jgi:hypothetical protein
MTVNPCAEQLLSPRQWCRLGEDELRRMWRLACDGNEKFISFFTDSGITPSPDVDPTQIINVWSGIPRSETSYISIADAENWFRFPEGRPSPSQFLLDFTQRLIDEHYPAHFRGDLSELFGEFSISEEDE